MTDKLEFEFESDVDNNQFRAQFANKPNGNRSDRSDWNITLIISVFASVIFWFEEKFCLDLIDYFFCCILELTEMNTDFK